MRLAFTKMHGLGNDFIVFDAAGPSSIGAVAVAPLSSVAMRVTSKEPGLPQACLTLSPLLIVPSPKLQA